MTENENQQSNWLAIASFVLGLIWSLLSLIIIGLPLWIICLILALIFGIVALCKKQAKRAWILWIIFSILWMIIVAVYTKFALQHKDEFIDPIKEFYVWIEENPETAALMENDEFSEKFDAVIEQKLQEKYGEKFSSIDSFDWIVDIRADLFEEMKNVATELAEQEWLNALVPVYTEEPSSTITICDEFYKSEEEISCTEQYEPVCGDNGQTYWNSCFACIEVNSYTNGECAAVEVEPVEIEPVVEE